MTTDRIRDLCQMAQEAIQSFLKPDDFPGDHSREGAARALALSEEALQLAKKGTVKGSFAHGKVLVVLGWVRTEVQGEASARECFAAAEELALTLYPTDPEGAIHVMGLVARWHAHCGALAHAEELLGWVTGKVGETFGYDHPRYLLLMSQGRAWLGGEGKRPLGLWHF